MKRGVYIPLPLGEKEVADYGVIGTLQVKLWNGKEPRGGAHMLGSWIYVFFSSYNVKLALRDSFGLCIYQIAEKRKIAHTSF